MREDHRVRYYCKFPGCGWETNNKQLMNNHHIVPRELGGINKRNNRILLCPTCHNRIYIPNSKSGIHSINSPEKIVLLGILNSTDGDILYYKNFRNEEFYYSFSSKENLKL